MFDEWREDTIIIMWLAAQIAMYKKPLPLGKWADKYSHGMIVGRGAFDYLSQLGFNFIVRPPSQKITCIAQDGTRSEIWT